MRAAEVRCSGVLPGRQHTEYTRRRGDRWSECDGGQEGDGGSTSSLPVPAEHMSPSSKASLYCLSMFHSLLPFTHFPCLFLPPVLHVTHPLLLLLPHPLPEALSSELPGFFIKEISLEPSNYYGKRKTERREGGHSGKRPLFIPFP